MEEKTVAAKRKEELFEQQKNGWNIANRQYSRTGI